MGQGLDVGRQKEEGICFFLRVGGGGLAARQAARAVTEGRQVLLGEGWINEINTP